MRGLWHGPSLSLIRVCLVPPGVRYLALDYDPSWGNALHAHNTFLDFIDAARSTTRSRHSRVLARPQETLCNHRQSLFRCSLTRFRSKPFRVLPTYRACGVVASLEQFCETIRVQTLLKLGIRGQSSGFFHLLLSLRRRHPFLHQVGALFSWDIVPFDLGRASCAGNAPKRWELLCGCLQPSNTALSIFSSTTRSSEV